MSGLNLFKIKAIPHKDCNANMQLAFSSDWSKRRRNTDVFQGVLGKNDGKDSSLCATKRAARSLRGVAINCCSHSLISSLEVSLSNLLPFSQSAEQSE